jgi:hypothetical protein
MHQTACKVNRNTTTISDYQIMNAVIPDDFRNLLSNLGVKSMVTVVARRAAGVWTHIPSMAIQSLLDMDNQARVLLLDFGLRNEMLEHFKIDYTRCDSKFSFLGIGFGLLSGQPLEVLDYYHNIINPDTKTVYTTGVGMRDEYIGYFSKLAELNKRLYICPYISGEVNEVEQTKLQLDFFCETLVEILKALHPDVVFVTFEGQPELRLFEERLNKNETMRFCMNVSDKILGMVRTDSLIRFDESIEIPHFLSTMSEWQNKLRLILTRHKVNDPLPEKYSDIVWGYIPTLDQIAQSVQDTGSIPLVDLLISGEVEESNQEDMAIASYLDNMRQISRRVLFFHRN